MRKTVEVSREKIKQVLESATDSRYRASKKCDLASSYFYNMEQRDLGENPRIRVSTLNKFCKTYNVDPRAIMPGPSNGELEARGIKLSSQSVVIPPAFEKTILETAESVFKKAVAELAAKYLAELRGK